MKKASFLLLILSAVMACNQPNIGNLKFEVYQTSAAGDKLMPKGLSSEKPTIKIVLKPEKRYQTFTGFGGAFTESSAYLLNKLSSAKREEILRAYFAKDGAAYSLTRTHMNSCDFSLNHYSYAPIEGDTALEYFSIDEDKDDIIPMIKRAQEISDEGFKIVASPWSAPPWMKDNQDWYGGKLLPKYYDTWALFFAKYAKAYSEEGIDIWAFTIENEPLGNDANWESMHYTPEETATFIKNNLAPKLSAEGLDVELLVYDQNRGEELNEWADVLLTDDELKPLIYGTAVHWYTSTYDWFPESLQYVHELAPDKHIIHTEGCVDAEIPHWRDDAWYWKKEATDWGWDWAKEEDKPKHPKYVPAYRYARDIIGCMNNWVEGWIDWNMVLNRQGGPNLAKNWCVAPIIVDDEADEVYYTPLYYIMSHFSKFTRPGAQRIGFSSTDDNLMVTAVNNPDGSTVIHILNMESTSKTFSIKQQTEELTFTIAAQALQTIVLK